MHRSFAGDLRFVKVLSASSWNYLGAKLIALDPTSHCNRLSANLGFSQCSQVSPRQCGHTELSAAPSPKVLTSGADFHAPLRIIIVILSLIVQLVGNFSWFFILNQLAEPSFCVQSTLPVTWLLFLPHRTVCYSFLNLPLTVKPSSHFPWLCLRRLPSFAAFGSSLSCTVKTSDGHMLPVALLWPHNTLSASVLTGLC